MLRFEPVKDSDSLVQVVEPVVETISRLPGVQHYVAIPAGYKFDGASIPRWAWSIVGAPFEPDFIVAACVHDWYCEHAHALGDYQARVVGDSVFFWLLRKAKVPRWRRVAMYLAVRLNSWYFYGRKSD